MPLDLEERLNRALKRADKLAKGNKMPTLNTIAAIKRLPVGTKLRLINCLMGPTDQPREAVKVRSKDLVFKTEKGSLSYASLSGVKVEATEKGFRLVASKDSNSDDPNAPNDTPKGTLLIEYVLCGVDLG